MQWVAQQCDGFYNHCPGLIKKNTASCSFGVLLLEMCLFCKIIPLLSSSLSLSLIKHWPLIIGGFFIKTRPSLLVPSDDSIIINLPNIWFVLLGHSMWSSNNYYYFTSVCKKIREENNSTHHSIKEEVDNHSKPHSHFYSKNYLIIIRYSNKNRS